MAETSLKPTPSTPKRDLLLDTAAELFNREGYHAVGIDTILAEAGLAKMTLYHHFASKDELIVAAIDRRGAAIAAGVEAALAAAGASPRKRLLALFDWYAQWFDHRDFNGCAFIRAAGEYPDPKSPVHQVVARHKQASRDRLAALLRELGVSEVEKVATQVHLLLEGAIVSAHLFSDPTVIRQARDAALALIKVDAG